MIADSVAFLVGAGQARAVYDAEHFFDGYRDDPGYALRLPARGRRRRRRARRAVRHQRRRRCRRRSRAASPSCARRCRACALGIHTPRRRRLRASPTRSPPSRPARRRCRARSTAIGERTGNANLVTIIANLQLKMGVEVLDADAARAPDRDRALRRRAAQPRARPRRSRTSASTRSRTRRGMHAAGVRADARDVRARRPGARRQPPRRARLRAGGPRHRRREGRRRRHRRSTTTAAARVVERVKELEHDGYQFEAADGSFELLMRKEAGAYEPLFRLESWRVIVEKRADGKVETEATIKIWVDGERYVRTAEGNGPVNALDKALRARDRRDPPAPARHRARQLQGPHPRRDEGHRRGDARADRRLRRPRRLGHDRRRRERDRRLVGGARRLARVRRCSRPPRLRRRRAEREPPGARESPTGRDRRASPAERRSRSPGPCSGEEEERRVLEVLRSGQLSLGPARARQFERRSRRASARAHASAVSSGTAGLHLALRAVGVADGDEVVTSPVLVRRQRQRRRSTSARGRCSPTSTRVTLNLDPQAAAAAVTDAHDGAAAGPHLRLPGRHAGVRARSGLPIVEDACEALGAVHADGTPVGARGNPAVFGFYANKQLTTGEGGMVTIARRRAEGAHRLRAQPGPRARHGLARPRPARVQLPAVATSPARSASRSWSASTRCSPAARGSAALYREALAGIEGLELPCEDSGGDRAWLVRLRRAAAARRRPRRRRSRALRERGVQSKPYLPAIHLMSFYRERFGHREGEFPVCEDVAARSLARPDPRAARRRPAQGTPARSACAS